MNLWLNYPFAKLLAFFMDPEVAAIRRREVKGHVLRIGPLAFAVLWQGAALDREAPK